MDAVVPYEQKSSKTYHVLAKLLQRQEGLFEKSFARLRRTIEGHEGLMRLWKDSPANMGVAMFYLVHSVHYIGKPRTLDQVIEIAKRAERDEDITRKKVEFLMESIEVSACGHPVTNTVKKVTSKGDLISITFCKDCFKIMEESGDTLEQDPGSSLVQIQPMLELLSATTGYPLEMFGLQEMFEDLMFRSLRWPEYLGDAFELLVTIAKLYDVAGLEGEVARMVIPLKRLHEELLEARLRFPELIPPENGDVYDGFLDFVNEYMKKTPLALSFSREWNILHDERGAHYKAFAIDVPPGALDESTRDAARAKAETIIGKHQGTSPCFYPWDFSDKEPPFTRELEGQWVIVPFFDGPEQQVYEVMVAAVVESVVSGHLDGLPRDTTGEMRLERVVALFVLAHAQVYFPSKLTTETMSFYLHVMKKMPEGKKFPFPETMDAWNCVTLFVCGWIPRIHGKELAKMRGFMGEEYIVERCPYCHLVYGFKEIENMEEKFLGVVLEEGVTMMNTITERLQSSSLKHLHLLAHDLDETGRMQLYILGRFSYFARVNYPREKIELLHITKEERKSKVVQYLLKHPLRGEMDLWDVYMDQGRFPYKGKLVDLLAEMARFKIIGTVDDKDDVERLSRDHRLRHFTIWIARRFLVHALELVGDGDDKALAAYRGPWLSARYYSRNEVVAAVLKELARKPRSTPSEILSMALAVDKRWKGKEVELGQVLDVLEGEGVIEGEDSGDTRLYSITIETKLLFSMDAS